MLKESKRATTFDNVLVKFNLVWGGNDLILSNDKIVWHIRVPNVRLDTYV